jgi:hypothetical protein
MTDHDFAQRTLLGLLLEEHPSMLTVEDIERRLSDVPRLREALCWCGTAWRAASAT